MTYRPQPRLTIKELRPIVEFYHTRLPAWRIVRDDTLIREDGPVAQGITFDRLSHGVYRPTGHVRVLVAPQVSWVFELCQKLNVKVRQVTRRQDGLEFRNRVIDAIRAEFVPSVDSPLVAEDVLDLYEQQANPPHSAVAYSLAALNAYLGKEKRALYWCSRFAELLDASGRQLKDFDYKQQEFVHSIEEWIKEGESKEQLERVLQAERRKWGLI